METPKANGLMVWTTNKMEWNQEREIQANIAGEILSMVYLKQIREEASAAYSCGAQGAFSYDEEGCRAYILASCPMKPEKKELAMKIMSDEVPNLAQKCDAEMLDKVKKAMLKQFDDGLKTNGYWLNVINSYDRYGMDINTNCKTLIESQTPEKISAFVKEFLKTANKITIAMLPEEAK
jgi:zinc protease